MDFSNINWLAVIVAAVAAFGVGGIWYGPLFGKQWQVEVGLSDDDIASANPALVFGPALLLTLVMSTCLAAIMPADSNLVSGAVFAAVISLALQAPAFGVNYLFARRSKALFGIDAGYLVVTFAVLGAVLGVWP